MCLKIATGNNLKQINKCAIFSTAGWADSITG